ncbi:hybrid sensor histidine kinase/response regulator [Hymenobacter yonginensis]|uniref:histidine kinase n=1 Tax=Hymenobacter yonginensis TaxID=748197 RepID=A0ABY7PJ80_9BACT|nr:hybrid sensor histidine kinase/response regulator [Hymenobacter yonginensis]WBO83353.1 ATP-binding protein [Hymenobacter yonginensis]
MRPFLLLFRLGLLLVLLLSAPRSWAQPGQAQYYLKQFGPAEGLPQPFIYALAQDRQGYLWIGTAEGLVRYDGTEFKTYTTKDGLAEDFVTQLYVQPSTGQLWAAHYQGGASRWNGQLFQAVAAGAARPRALRTPPGIAPLDTARNTLNLPQSLASRLPDVQQVLPAGTVLQCQLTDQEQTVWIGTAGQGLWRWADRHISFYPNPASPAAPLALQEGGRVAGISAGGQYFTLNPTVGQPSPLIAYPFRHLPYPPSVVLRTPSERANPVFDNRYPEPAPQMLWAGTQGHGLWQLPIPSGERPMRRVRRLPSTLTVTALTQHPGGDLWVGTALDGVYRLPADTTQAAEHFTTANGLLHNTIYALAADSAGRVWLGTHDTGLAFWQRGRFHYFRFRTGAIDVSALLTDDAGRVWIGTEGSGVLCYRKGKLRPYGPSEGLLSPYCYALLPVRWGASYHGGYRHDFRTEQVLAVHRNALSFLEAERQRFRPVALPDNPLVRELLPAAAVAWNDYCVWIQTRSGLLCVRTNYPVLPSLSVPTPAIIRSEVDGAAQAPQQLGQLSATRHRLGFAFRAVSLLAGPASLQYQYRLRGYDMVWSKPSTATEAQFAQLDAGTYEFEVRARRGEQGAWSRAATVAFSIATPFWRTWWFAALSVLTAGAGIWAFVRGREAVLRQQKLQLETTVRERTQELRHQNAHIEEMNAELTVARDVAEASRKAKAQFLANMSHEIRTPMNAVIGLSHLLRQTPLTGEQSEYLEAVQSSSQNLLVIINDILDSSKIEAGKMTLEHTAFRLPELLRRVASMFRFATESKQLYFRLEIGPGVPAAVFGDPVRLNQVLVNLVGNAIKFTTRGGVTLRVSVPGEATGTARPAVRFAVQDTGIGIPADKLDAIFEDFSQANTSTTRQFGGTGLGLSIARNLVELHGGQLGVDSQDGVGSTFHFSIAYEAADPATVPAEASLAVGRFEPALHVLVAEDNELNQLVARKTLEAWNVQVTIAANGRLAVEAAAAHPFDAVLMDVQMPEMDGYEASRQLRMLFPDASQFPIIGLTASALPEDRALALEAGMNDTLAKPFDPAVLFARLAQHTRRPTTEATAPAEVPAAAPAEVAPATPAAALDWTLLEELAGGNEAFIGQIIRTFLTQAPLLQQELAAAFTATDHEALARTAHKLKGQVAYFGVPALHGTLEQLEQQARQQASPDQLAAGLGYLELQLADLYPLIQARIMVS